MSEPEKAVQPQLLLVGDDSDLRSDLASYLTRLCPNTGI